MSGYLDEAIIGYFTVTFVAGFSWLFSAHVTGFEPSAPVDGALTASVSLKITGKPIIV